MDRDIFITDERLPFSRMLDSRLTSAGYNVLLTSEGTSEKAIQWNRNTPFALQQLNLQLKNKNMSLETAILNFDALEFSKIYASNTLIAIDKTCTELITAYANLCLILRTIMIKQDRGRLIFVLRTPEAEQLDNFALNMAISAFITLAENTSLFFHSRRLPKLQSLLVRLETPDQSSADWLISQIELPVLSRNAGKWVRAGQRGLFSK
ncbi:MAG: hypothetical protein P1P64_07880 [Treponemataceae bacterium]